MSAEFVRGRDNTASWSIPAESREIIPFPAARRSRGRPKKDLRPTPCTETFDTVALTIALVASGKDKATRALWAAAKAAAMTAALNDSRLRDGATCGVLDVLIRHINRDAGFDWHGIQAIAELCIDVQTRRPLDRSTVIRCLKKLVSFGYALRRMQPVHNGRPGQNKRGETTLPILMKAIAELRAKEPVNGSMVAEKQEHGGRKKLEDGDKDATRISRTNLEMNPSSDCLDPSVEARHPLVTSELAKAVKRSLRYDVTRPLNERIALWNLAEPTNEEERKLRDRLRRAARGHDLVQLRTRYCDWIARGVRDGTRKTPHDAAEAFIAWVYQQPLGPFHQ